MKQNQSVTVDMLAERFLSRKVREKISEVGFDVRELRIGIDWDGLSIGPVRIEAGAKEVSVGIAILAALAASKMLVWVLLIR